MICAAGWRWNRAITPAVSMARKTVAVRGFFAWAYEHGLTNTDPAATLMTPSIPSTLPAVLTESQAEQLLDVAEHAVATNQYKDDGGAAAASGRRQGSSARQLISRPIP